jgi:hypothetical protein
VGREGETARYASSVVKATSKPKTRATRLQDFADDPRIKGLASRAEYLSFERANPYYCIASMSTSVIGAHTSPKDHFRLSKLKGYSSRTPSHTLRTRGKSTKLCWTGGAETDCSL